MRRSVGFLTASGFLSAILLVWAQLWISSRGNVFDWASSLGLIWTYIAVLLSLIASVIAIYSDLKRARTQVPNPAICLLVIAFGMAVIDVSQSIGSRLVFVAANASSIPDWLSRYTSYSVEYVCYVTAAIVLSIIILIAVLLTNRISRSREEVPQSTSTVKENTPSLTEVAESGKPIENDDKEVSES